MEEMKEFSRRFSNMKGWVAYRMPESTITITVSKITTSMAMPINAIGISFSYILGYFLFTIYPTPPHSILLNFIKFAVNSLCDQN
jgi:hypothetical protein